MPIGHKHLVNQASYSEIHSLNLLICFFLEASTRKCYQSSVKALPRRYMNYLLSYPLEPRMLSADNSYASLTLQSVIAPRKYHLSTMPTSLYRLSLQFCLSIYVKCHLINNLILRAWLTYSMYIERVDRLDCALLIGTHIPTKLTIIMGLLIKVFFCLGNYLVWFY